MNSAGNLLRKRARSLAEARNEDNTPTLEVLLFLLDGRKLAVESSRVENVFRFQRQLVTALPGCPESIAGVINFGGELLPLVRAAHLIFGRRESSSQESSVVIVKVRDEVYGLLLDEILGIRKLPTNQLLIPSRQSLSPWISSVTRDEITLLDAEALLTHQNLGFGGSWL